MTRYFGGKTHNEGMIRSAGPAHRGTMHRRLWPFVLVGGVLLAPSGWSDQGSTRMEITLTKTDILVLQTDGTRQPTLMGTSAWFEWACRHSGAHPTRSSIGSVCA